MRFCDGRTKTRHPGIPVAPSDNILKLLQKSLGTADWTVPPDPTEINRIYGRAGARDQ
jgi:hypothetical protein